MEPPFPFQCSSLFSASHAYRPVRGGNDGHAVCTKGSVTAVSSSLSSKRSPASEARGTFAKGAVVNGDTLGDRSVLRPAAPLAVQGTLWILAVRRCSGDLVSPLPSVLSLSTSHSMRRYVVPGCNCVSIWAPLLSKLPGELHSWSDLSYNWLRGISSLAFLRLSVQLD